MRAFCWTFLQTLNDHYKFAQFGLAPYNCTHLSLKPFWSKSHFLLNIISIAVIRQMRSSVSHNTSSTPKHIAWWIVLRILTQSILPVDFTLSVLKFRIYWPFVVITVLTFKTAVGLFGLWSTSAAGCLWLNKHNTVTPSGQEINFTQGWPRTVLSLRRRSGGQSTAAPPEVKDEGLAEFRVLGRHLGSDGGWFLAFGEIKRVSLSALTRNQQDLTMSTAGNCDKLVSLQVLALF